MAVEKGKWGGETCRMEERAVGKETEMDGKITLRIRDDGIDWADQICEPQKRARRWDFFRIDESWIELGCVDPQSTDPL